MSPEHVRMQLLLARLGQLDLQLPAPHERAILEVARQALRDELQQLSHRLLALGYCRANHPVLRTA